MVYVRGEWYAWLTHMSTVRVLVRAVLRVDMQGLMLGQLVINLVLASQHQYKLKVMQYLARLK